MDYVIDYLENLKLDKTDIAYLASLHGNDGKQIFEKGGLDYLGGLKFECDIDAMPEGTIVFPYEPLMRVKGKIIQANVLLTRGSFRSGSRNLSMP